LSIEDNDNDNDRHRNGNEESINQDQMDLIAQNAQKLLEKKKNMNKKGVLNLGDSLKLNKMNKKEGWTVEQEQNRINFEEEDVDENMLAKISNTLENTNKNMYGDINLNTQEMKDIKSMQNGKSIADIN
jgi:hypothetical protein